MVTTRMVNDAQILFRAEAAHKFELEAVAASLGLSAAELMRQMLDEQLPALRKKADEAVAKRDRLPHGVSDSETEKAVASLLRVLAKKDPVRLYMHDFLTPESRALWVVLGFIWGEPDGALAKRLAEVVASELPAAKPSKPASKR